MHTDSDTREVMYGNSKSTHYQEKQIEDNAYTKTVELVSDLTNDIFNHLTINNIRESSIKIDISDDSDNSIDEYPHIFSKERRSESEGRGRNPTLEQTINMAPRGHVTGYDKAATLTWIKQGKQDSIAEHDS